ncbi:MAG TPA: ATP-binding protein [Thermodesulfovibrionales bacterium]|nr:ATP-binding protein [Thermodesulfovibrionales bacterium]
MMIEHKIILSNGFNLLLIACIGLVAFQDMNSTLTKLRFVEIADDLNVSFLEMRLSEKNYFLYHDKDALSEIEEKVAGTRETIRSVRRDIVRATGEDKVRQLEEYLESYAGIVESLNRSGSVDAESQTLLRAEGRKLKEFSDKVTQIERSRVNEIIANSKRVLFLSFCGVLVLAFLIGHSVSRSIVRPIKEIEQLAHSISAGNFRKIESAAPKDETGAVLQAINSMSEELRNREEQIIQSKKLASLGILVAGVAHELNNPLNNISMIAQTYQEAYEGLSREQRLEFMEKIEGETERIQAVVRNLLDFAKPKEPNLEKADMNEVVRTTLRLVQNMLDVSNIETVLYLGEGLPPVFIDQPQIRQVLVNLITNAIQAMSSGGRLNISTRPGKEPGTVEVSILDTGKGIPQEFMPHIFDPFFSTKEEGGTGLGLWVSYGIIKSHKGTIFAESKIGSGTIFTVQLPVYGKGEKA